jgi:hypothetical protein
MAILASSESGLSSRLARTYPNAERYVRRASWMKELKSPHPNTMKYKIG